MRIYAFLISKCGFHAFGLLTNPFASAVLRIVVRGLQQLVGD
jgi:hypothetical protein